MSLHFITNSDKFELSIEYIFCAFNIDFKFIFKEAFAGMAKAPPVPKKSGVKLGIWPNFYT